MYPLPHPDDSASESMLILTSTLCMLCSVCSHHGAGHQKCGAAGCRPQCAGHPGALSGALHLRAQPHKKGPHSAAAGRKVRPLIHPTAAFLLPHLGPRIMVAPVILSIWLHYWQPALCIGRHHRACPNLLPCSSQEDVLAVPRRPCKAGSCMLWLDASRTVQGAQPGKWDASPWRHQLPHGGRPGRRKVAAAARRHECGAARCVHHRAGILRGRSDGCNHP